MPPFNPNGPRLQFPLKSQAKRHALSSNVLDSCNGEKRTKPFETRTNGTMERRGDENGYRVGPLSMQERLRLASGGEPSLDTIGNLSHEPTRGGKVSATETGKVPDGGAAGLGVLPADCQPIPVSTLPEFPGPGMGLANMGNTCYLNSVLQCLLHTPPLHNLLHKRLHSRHCELADSGFNGGFCPMCLLEKRLRCSFYDPEKRFPRPVAIAKSLHNLAPQLRIGEQEDAHELLRLMIDACHRTCLLQQRGVPLTALKKFEDRTGKVPTVMSDIFGGVLQSQVKCLSCGAESNKRDVFMDLSLDLSPSTHSVAAALHAFVAPEKLDGSNKYRCEKCKRLSPARKQMQVLKAPNVLVIQLKRFEDVRGGKITRHIHFHEHLNLADVMAPTSREPSPEYTLYSLIVHEGYSQQMGHYYALSRVNHSWYLFNDSDVRPVSWGDVARRGAYILFYQKTRPRGAVFFYPPKSQGPVKAEGQLPKAETGGAASATGAQTRPVIGPQLPAGYRGPVKAEVEERKTAGAGPSGACGVQTGPVYGPQLPAEFRGLVKAEVQQPEPGLAGRVGASGVQTGPVNGPQLPTAHEGLVESESGAGAPQQKEESVAAFKPARSSSGSQPPGIQPGPVKTNASAEVVRNSAASDVTRPQIPSSTGGPVPPTASSQNTRNSATAAQTGPFSGPHFSPSSGGPIKAGNPFAEGVLRAGNGLPGPRTGPHEPEGLVNGAVGSNIVENEMNREPARPPPPDIPPSPKGPVSQAVTVEGNPRTEREGTITGPESAQIVMSDTPEIENSGAGLLTQPTISQNQDRNGCADEGASRDAAVAVLSTEATNGGIDGHVARAGAAVERPPSDLKRRLSDAGAAAKPEPKRRLSDGRGKEEKGRSNACGDPSGALPGGPTLEGTTRPSESNPGGFGVSPSGNGVNLGGKGVSPSGGSGCYGALNGTNGKGPHSAGESEGGLVKSADPCFRQIRTEGALPRGGLGLARQGQGKAEVASNVDGGPQVKFRVEATGAFGSTETDGCPAGQWEEPHERTIPGSSVAEIGVGGSHTAGSGWEEGVAGRVTERVAEPGAQRFTEVITVAGYSTASSVPVGLSEGRLAREPGVSGRVEILVDATAWSLAAAYSSDEDECEVLLRGEPKPHSTVSSCERDVVLNEEKSAEGLGMFVGFLPGLVEAEALLRQGGIFSNRGL